MIRGRLCTPEIHLIDDGQHRYFKEYCVQPRALDENLQIVAHRANRDVRSVEMKQRQKIHKVAFDVAKTAQVIQLVFAKSQFAERINFAVHLVGNRRQNNARVAALEAIFDLSGRKLMQNRLHHGEFVDVGVEEGANDHGIV